MSVFSNYVTSLNRAGTFGGNDEVRRALVTHIAPNYLLRSGMQSRQIIETAVKAADGEDRAEGYRLLCILLSSGVPIEESKLATIFERLPALIESVNCRDEEEHLLSLVELVYANNLASTIERIEKVLVKLIGTINRLIQNRKNKRLSMSLLLLLLSSKSRSSIQPQVYNNIRKACVSIVLDDHNTMRLAARTIALCNSAETAEFWQNEFCMYCHDALRTVVEMGIKCDIPENVSKSDKSVSVFDYYMTSRMSGAGKALKLETLFSALMEILSQVCMFVSISLCVCVYLRVNLCVFTSM